MRAIVNTGPNRLEMLEYPLPQPAAGQARIRAGACGICATDLEMIAGWERTDFPAIPGHEWAGVIDAVGPGGDAAAIGRKCVAENVLADGGEVGFEHPGGYAEYFLTECEKVRLLPDDFSLSTAVLIEPLAVTVRAIRRLGEQPREPALILGDGPIGLLALLLLKKAGLNEVVVAGGREYRLQMAQEFGAARTINYHRLAGELSSAIKGAAGSCFATLIEASGAEAAIHAAVELAGADGRILALGDYRRARARFQWNTLLLRELRLIGSNASAGAWPEAVRLAVAERLPLAKLISHRLPAEQFAGGIELLRGRRPDVLKVVLEWSGPC